MKCPDSIEELEEIAKMIPLCRVTLFDQAKAKIESGAATSLHDASRQIGEETERKPESIERSIRREQANRGGTVSPSTQKFRTSFTGENEWYTPATYLDAAKSVMGGIDLDPASSETAQETVIATEYFTIKDDGLSLPWHGRVWLNPPYSQPQIMNFIQKAVDEYKQGNVSECIILTNNYTDTAWFHLAESVCAGICFTRGRIKFEGASGTPTQGSCFFYFGSSLNNFTDVFKEFGFVR